MAAAYIVLKNGNVQKVLKNGRTNPELKQVLPNGPGDSEGIMSQVPGRTYTSGR